VAILDPSTRPTDSLAASDIQALIAELLPPFRWRLQEVPLGLDYPHWVENRDFDLDFHVRELALATPGTDAQLAEQVARIVARPLDRSRPLWELLPDLRIGFRPRATVRPGGSRRWRDGPNRW